MSDKAFLKLPRVLITEPLRSKLSDSAIVLYSYLISLYELSVRNGERFRDENGRYYVVCPISTVMRLLNCCNKKACIRSLKIKILSPANGRDSARQI